MDLPAHIDPKIDPKSWYIAINVPGMAVDTRHPGIL